MSYTLGLSGPYFHDSSACLLDASGEVVAFVEEERFSRQKHNIGSRRSTRSVEFCLEKAGIDLSAVDEIAVAWNPYWPSAVGEITEARMIEEVIGPSRGGGFKPMKLTVINHHLAHAGSAFYPSGFADSAVIVVDGSGDGVSTSIWHGSVDGLKLMRSFPITQSLGWFFESVAEYLGLGDGTSAGKLMGLAPYGDPDVRLDFVSKTDSTPYFIDLSRFGISSLDDYDHADGDLEYYRAVRAAYQRAFAEAAVSWRPSGPPRNLGSELGLDSFSQFELNLAASAQQMLEKALLRLAHEAMALTGSRNLCISGGVGLNCKANGRLAREAGAVNFFVQPAASDSGCALGSALECLHRDGGLVLPRDRLKTVALGPSYSDAIVADTLKRCQIDFEYLGDSIAERAASDLSMGKTIGWFQGAVEAGPRALGNRSILADPRSTATRDRINRDIKRREMWRPFGPSILEASLDDYVESTGPAEFMVVAHEASAQARCDLGATVHVDGSLRPHMVVGDQQPRFTALLEAFAAETGVGALLNTSFNHEAEPIVCSPIDAVRTFFSTPLDVLAIGGIVVTKG